jgi:tRNA (guanine-N7-)-methyltransferase
VSRMRGPVQDKPEGPGAWVLLNAQLFGDNGIGGHNVAVRSEALPVDWSAIFGREAPRTLEIGFNRARFLQEITQAWPGHDHIGIELRRRYGWWLANTLGENPEAPQNLRILWADAKLVTPAIFKPGSLDAIFINFPDPWWKKRHVKRRLVDLDFADSMAKLLAPGGRIWVKSDVPHIAEEIDTALAAVPILQGPTEFGEADLPLTHREVKCVAAGMPIYRFWYSRPA